jgi:hypothetical protein
MLIPKKNVNGSHHGFMTAPKNPTNLFQPQEEEIVDLTMTHHESPDKKDQSNQLFKKRRILWDMTTSQIKEYNPLSTPIQMFSHSKTLKNTTTNQTWNNFAINLRHNPNNHPSPKNPFYSIRNQSNQQFCGGRARGRKRGSYLKTRDY